jgi:hypothetical protein
MTIIAKKGELSDGRDHDTLRGRGAFENSLKDSL